MGLDQIKAEYIEHELSDLSVANTARVSFGNWNEEFDKKRDTKLISYLAKHEHISPFFHQRFTFKGLRLPLDKLLSDDKLTMGLAYSRVEGEDYFQHSFYGWVSILKKGLVPTMDADLILKTLYRYMPVSSGAFNLPLWIERSKEPDAKFIENPINLGDKFTTIALRLTMPIFVARQMFTHRRFATNEISRRYVDTTPEFYEPDCWRKRPEQGIKQGSSKECVNVLQADNALYTAEQIATTSQRVSEDAYVKLVEGKVAPEMARMVLPQSMMTQVIFTGSLSAWEDMLRLRTENHAQYETRCLANQIIKEVSKYHEM